MTNLMALALLLRGAQPVGEHLVVLALVIAVDHHLLVELLAHQFLLLAACSSPGLLALAVLVQPVCTLLGTTLLEEQYKTCISFHLISL